MQWSPWLSKRGVSLENPTWREVAQKLNNKGLVRLKDLWDDSRNQWLDKDEILQCHSLSLLEDVMVSRLHQVLWGQPSPLGVNQLSWDCWTWPMQRPNTKVIYLLLKESSEWVKVVNKA